MKKLKEVVDKQRDEIRAKDRELGLKNEDVEAVSGSLSFSCLSHPYYHSQECNMNYLSRKGPEPSPGHLLLPAVHKRSLRGWVS